MTHPSDSAALIRPTTGSPTTGSHARPPRPRLSRLALACCTAALLAGASAAEPDDPAESDAAATAIAATSAVESLSFPNGEDPRYAAPVRRFPPKKIIMPRPLPLIAALIVSAGALASCAKQHIVNTDVDDTSENRKVVRFCEEYRHAVEEKDVARLIAMADAKYEDDGGTNKHHGENDDDKNDVNDSRWRVLSML